MTAELVPSLLPTLRKRRDLLRGDLLTRMERGASDADLHADVGALCDLEERVTSMESEDERAGNPTAIFSAKSGSDPSARNAAMRYNDDSHLTYRKNGPDSWLRDLVLFSTGADTSGESRQRLAAHAEDVRTNPGFHQFEQRDISRVDGSGGYAVPPLWLVDQYIELARPGRPFADLCQRQNLPAGCDVVNIPKVLTGTAVGIQTADNTAVVDVDITDSFVSAPVRTISGQIGVAIQLLDQSPIDFSNMLFSDLVRAHATATDLQVMTGTGTSGQVLGVDYTSGINTITASSSTVMGIYSAIADAIQTIHSTRYMPPEVIVMHPRRWGFMLASADNQNRPLFLPNANGPMNVQGVLENVASQGVVGQMHGLPVVVDASITTSAGNGSPSGTEDLIYVMRASDLVLWESQIRTRILMEPKAASLTAICQIYSYLAFSAGRYPQSVCVIGGLSAPTF